uniref:Uncharacterized protein n=1 Tax=Clastoptera arizonana TaxID=38151 RepID=A0A1B6D2H1_9HEMI
MKYSKQRRNNFVREASKRLGLILRTSRKLSILPQDLTRLDSVAKLKSACVQGTSKYEWAWTTILVLVVASVALYLTMTVDIAGTFDCKKNSSDMFPIQSVRVESSLKLPSKNNQEAIEDPGYPWAPSKLNLRRDR